jgi:SOS-response transcriptional repressor LexA
MEPLEEGAYAASSHIGTTISVHAGFPNPAAERSGAPLSLDKLLVRHASSTYFFRIRGHTWHRWGIFDGDIAIIDRAPTPRARELVIWWEEDGAFMLSPYDRAIRPNIWGTITAIIHPFGETSRQPVS